MKKLEETWKGLVMALLLLLNIVLVGVCVNAARAYHELLDASSSYVDMLEDDLGIDYLDDVACETDAYVDYHHAINK